MLVQNMIRKDVCQFGYAAILGSTRDYCKMQSLPHVRAPTLYSKATKLMKAFYRCHFNFTVTLVGYGIASW